MNRVNIDYYVLQRLNDFLFHGYLSNNRIDVKKPIKVFKDTGRGRLIVFQDRKYQLPKQREVLDYGS